MKDFPHTREDIINACNQVRKGRRDTGFNRQFRNFEKDFNDEFKITNGERFYTNDFLNIMLDWHKTTQIRLRTQKSKRAAGQIAPNDATEPNPINAITINLSRENWHRLRRLENAGGNAHTYINRLIDSDFGE